MQKLLKHSVLLLKGGFVNPFYYRSPWTISKIKIYPKRFFFFFASIITMYTMNPGTKRGLI